MVGAAGWTAAGNCRCVPQSNHVFKEEGPAGDVLMDGRVVLADSPAGGDLVIVGGVTVGGGGFFGSRVGGW
jgi:hypothetical protein